MSCMMSLHRVYNNQCYDYDHYYIVNIALVCLFGGSDSLHRYTVRVYTLQACQYN